MKDESLLFDRFNSLWARYTGHTRIGLWSIKNAEKKALEMLKTINLPKNSHILDLGCGTGRSMKAFKDEGFSNIVGIDCSQESLKLCQENGLIINRDIFLMDGAHTTFKDGEFDLVFSEGVLEHYKSFSPLVIEMARISKGYIMLVQPSHFSLFGILVFIVTHFFRDNVWEHSYRKKDYCSPFERMGLHLRLFGKTLLGEHIILLFEKSS